jgi:acetate kinase
MILIINAGSNYLKYKLFDEGNIIKSGQDEYSGLGKINHLQAWEKLYQSLSVHRGEIKAVGHRIVHGGDKYRESVLITKDVLNELKQLIDLAPLHLPAELEVIEIAQNVFGNIPQVAVFDTTFFQELSLENMLYPLPQGINAKFRFRRFGFHGISHQYALKKAQEELGMIRTQRAVTLYLGSGCSVAAIKDGQCVDTSMGFTPMEGLMMMTRSGDIDPGIIFYLLRNGFSFEEVEKMLNESSGILGVTDLTGHMKDVLYLAGYKVEQDYRPNNDLPKNEQSIKKARLAIDMFANKIIKYVGGYAAELGGLDSLIFTGPIGAGSAEIRNMISSRLSFFGEFEVFTVEPDEEEEMRKEVERVAVQN